MHKLIAATAAIALFSTAAQALPHGKPGLWSITTTMSMKNMPQIPPEALKMMKERGIKMPGMGEPIVTQICMTPDDVLHGSEMMTRARKEHGIDCTPRVLSETGSSIATEVVCHGEMEGTGHSHMSWNGDTHYEGDYSFKGVMHGQANETSTHFMGNFVKADCGAVKPFRMMPAH